MSARAGFNPHIHGARGLFSLMVFVFHVAHSGLPTFVFPGSEAVQFFLLSFQFGVELFFGISGIVILGALARAQSLPAFVWDRITRIYPVLWATLLAIIALTLLARAALPSDGDIALNFLIPPPFVSVRHLNPAAWSLTFEISFYALCALGWTIRMRRGAKPLFGAVAVAATALFPRTMLMAPGLLIGGDRLERGWIARASRYPLATLLLFLLVWRWADALSGEVLTINLVARTPLEWLSYLPLVAAAALLGTLTLNGIAAGHGLLGRLLTTRVMLWTGTISYSFYLWHPIVLAVVKRALRSVGAFELAGPGSQLLFFMVALPIALGVAAVSQRLIEVRLTRLLRLVIQREHEPVVTTAEAGSGRAVYRGGLFKRLWAKAIR